MPEVIDIRGYPKAGVDIANVLIANRGEKKGYFSHVNKLVNYEELRVVIDGGNSSLIDIKDLISEGYHFIVTIGDSIMSEVSTSVMHMLLNNERISKAAEMGKSYTHHDLDNLQDTETLTRIRGLHCFNSNRTSWRCKQHTFLNSTSRGWLPDKATCCQDFWHAHFDGSTVLSLRDHIPMIQDLSSSCKCKGLVLTGGAAHDSSMVFNEASQPENCKDGSLGDDYRVSRVQKYCHAIMVNLRKTAYSPRIADWDRESSLKRFYSLVQKSVSSQHKLVHLSPTRLDPLIMGANPPKNDRYMFQQFGVMELWSEQDSKLAETKKRFVTF